METEKKGNGESSLNDSWVELHFANTPGSGVSSSGENSVADDPRPSACTMDLEKLLLEAQRESRDNSRTGSTVPSRASPKTPHSPASPEKESGATELSGLSGPDQNAWVWDWSSRIEAIPPRDMGKMLKRPVQPRSTNLSVRKSKLLDGALWSWENLPALLFSHACTFFLGAAAMFVYVKKYCKWATAGANLTVD